MIVIQNQEHDRIVEENDLLFLSKITFSYCRLWDTESFQDKNQVMFNFIDYVALFIFLHWSLNKYYCFSSEI